MQLTFLMHWISIKCSSWGREIWKTLGMGRRTPKRQTLTVIWQTVLIQVHIFDRLHFLISCSWGRHNSLSCWTYLLSRQTRSRKYTFNVIPFSGNMIKSITCGANILGKKKLPSLSPWRKDWSGQNPTGGKVAEFTNKITVIQWRLTMVGSVV